MAPQNASPNFSTHPSRSHPSLPSNQQDQQQRHRGPSQPVSPIKNNNNEGGNRGGGGGSRGVSGGSRGGTRGRGTGRGGVGLHNISEGRNASGNTSQHLNAQRQSPTNQQHTNRSGPQIPFPTTSSSQLRSVVPPRFRNQSSIHPFLSQSSLLLPTYDSSLIPPSTLTQPSIPSQILDHQYWRRSRINGLSLSPQVASILRRRDEASLGKILEGGRHPTSASRGGGWMNGNVYGHRGGRAGGGGFIGRGSTVSRGGWRGEIRNFDIGNGIGNGNAQYGPPRGIPNRGSGLSTRGGGGRGRGSIAYHPREWERSRAAWEKMFFERRVGMAVTGGGGAGFGVGRGRRGPGTGRSTAEFGHSLSGWDEKGEDTRVEGEDEKSGIYRRERIQTASDGGWIDMNEAAGERRRRTRLGTRRAVSEGGDLDESDDHSETNSEVDEGGQKYYSGSEDDSDLSIYYPAEMDGDEQGLDKEGGQQESKIKAPSFGSKEAEDAKAEALEVSKHLEGISLDSIRPTGPLNTARMTIDAEAKEISQGGRGLHASLETPLDTADIFSASSAPEGSRPHSRSASHRPDVFSSSSVADWAEEETNEWNADVGLERRQDKGGHAREEVNGNVDGRKAFSASSVGGNELEGGSAWLSWGNVQDDGHGSHDVQALTTSSRAEPSGVAEGDDWGAEPAHMRPFRSSARPTRAEEEEEERYVGEESDIFTGPSWPNSLPVQSRKRPAWGTTPVLNDITAGQRQGRTVPMTPLRSRTVSFPATLAPRLTSWTEVRPDGPRTPLTPHRVPLPLSPRERAGLSHVYQDVRQARLDAKEARFAQRRRIAEANTRWKARKADLMAQKREQRKEQLPQRERPYRFAPDTFSMGVVDADGTFKPGFCFPTIESSIAWDTTKRAFLLDVIPNPANDELLPPALEMVDARIAIEDIATRGIALTWAPVYGAAPTHGGVPYQGDIRDVTLTLTLRRPPQFFVPLLDEWGKLSHRRIKVNLPLPVSPSGKEESYVPIDKLIDWAGELDLANLDSVDPYLSKHRSKKVEDVLDADGRSRKLSGGVLLGPKEVVMAKEVRLKVNELRNLPVSPESLAKRRADSSFGKTPQGPIGYDSTQPDGMSGRVRRRPIETGVLKWRRATEFDFSISRTGCENDAGEVGVDSDVHCKVNTWLSYRFTFYMNERGYDSLERLLRRVRVMEKEEDAQYLAELLERDPVHLDDGTVTPRAPLIAESTIKPVKLYVIDDLAKLPFSTRYLVEGLVSQAIIQSYQVEELLRSIWEIIGKDVDIIDAVLDTLFTFESIRNISATLKKRYALFRQVKKVQRQWRQEDSAGNHRRMMRKVVITPTRMLLSPAEQETSNSILRMYSRHSDRFLRVQFNDEHDRLAINSTVLDADAINPATGTISRVRRILTHGLRIAGRKYIFLAASSSQSKETSCWFFCELTKSEPGGPLRVKQIMDSMGQISEAVIAKYAARQGLVFSSSVPTQIAVKRRKNIPDILTPPDEEGESYNHTDGVGKCAQNVCDAAAEALGMTTDVDLHPSAVQFRMGGSKGLLVAWPDVKPREVWLRPSQVKFDSDLKDLHACRISQYRNAFLNRQFCILLCELGVPRQFFLAAFIDQAKRVIDLPDRVRKGAISAKDLDMVERVSAFPIRHLISSGFQNDPVLQDILSVVERRMLSELRWHCRIEIEEGVYMFGIADETGTLEQGEVFCQYNNPIDYDKGNIVVVGKCSICRAPALHPGDIRLVNAVDNSRLRHLVNVIVFSVKGDRDLPNQLGGGDLDGDEFTLCWSKDIVNNITEVPPASYKAKIPTKMPWVIPEDIKENYVTHLLNDILGQCGNAHLAFADSEGPSSSKCLAICDIYSTAVDFAKTGVAAQLPNDLRPTRWPDFMGKPAHMSYPGKSILGDLFRHGATVEPKGKFHPKTRDDVNAGSMDPRLSTIQVPKAVLKLALTLKLRYDMTITYLLLRYQLTEMEILSGLALRNVKRKRIRDNDLKEPLRDAYKELVRSTTELAEAAMAGMQLPSTGSSALQLFAVAAYQVTYDHKYDEMLEDEEQELDAEAEEEPKLISFAWVLWQELLSLAI